MVAMRSIKHHTYDGIERPPNTIYQVDESFVETVVALGMAMRVEMPAAKAAPPAKSKK